MRNFRKLTALLLVVAVLFCLTVLAACSKETPTTTKKPAQTTAPTTTKPTVDTTAPTVDTTAPTVDTTAPTVDTTVPPVDTTVPPVDTTVPSQGDTEVKVNYVVTVVDQDGNKVEGVGVAFCLDDVCGTPLTTDADGVVKSELVEGAWKVHVVSAPEGYTFSEDYVNLEDGKATLVVTKKAATLEDLGFVVEHQNDAKPVQVVDGKVVGGQDTIVLKGEKPETAAGTYTLVYNNNRNRDNGLVFAHLNNEGNTWEGAGTAYYFVFVSPEGVYFGEANGIEGGAWTMHANAGADKIEGFKKDGDHTLVVEYDGKGGSIVWLDGVELFTVSDGTYPKGTGYGFRTGMQGVTLTSLEYTTDRTIKGLGYTIDHQQEVNPVTIVDGKLVGGDGSIVLKNDTNKTALGVYTLVYENKTTMDRFGDNGLVFAHERTGENTWEGAGTAYYFVFVNPDGVYFGEANGNEGPGWTAHKVEGKDKIDGFTKEGKHTLVVEYFGKGHSKVSLDGVELFEVHDDTYPKGTSYGFRAGNNGPVLESLDFVEAERGTEIYEPTTLDRLAVGGWADQNTWAHVADGIKGDFVVTTVYNLETDFGGENAWRGALPIVQDGTVKDYKGSVWVTRMDWYGWCDQWDSAAKLGTNNNGELWCGEFKNFFTIMDNCQITWECKRVGDTITNTFTIVDGENTYTHVSSCTGVTTEKINLSFAAEFGKVEIVSIDYKEYTPDVYTATVADLDGNVFPGVTVSLYDAIEDTLVATAVTDENGVATFVFDATAEAYYVSVSGVDGYLDATASFWDSTETELTLGKIPTGASEEDALPFPEEGKFTVSVVDGAPVYYQSYMIANKTLVINSDVAKVVIKYSYADENWQLVEKTVELTPENGVINYYIASMSMPLFAFSTTDGSSADYEVEFVSPAGSFENPITIESESVTANVLESSDGVYYSYTPAKDGFLAVYCDNSLSSITVNNFTKNLYGDPSEGAAAIYTAVSAGDEIQIIANTVYDWDTWSSPAAEYVFTLEIVDAIPEVPTTPTTPEEILKAAYALEKGANLEGTYTLTGVITEINSPYSQQYQNVSVVMVVDGLDEYPMLCYRIKGEGADQIGIGDTITVTGTITNYNGTIEYVAGSTLDSWENTGEDLVKLEDPKEIVEAAYALEEGTALPFAYTLKGVITKVKTAYSSQYKNITVVMVVEGLTEMPITCYRLKGAGAENIDVGDTITVTGTIKNYYGTIEFDTGCTLDSVEFLPLGEYGYNIEHQQDANPITVADGKIVGGEGSIILKRKAPESAAGTYTLVYNNTEGGDNGLVFAHTRTGGNTWEGTGTAYYFVFVCPEGVYFGEANGNSTAGPWTAHKIAGKDKIDGFTKAGEHTLTVEYDGKGGSVVWLDGAELFSVYDPSYPTGTGYGFRSGVNGPVLGSLEYSTDRTIKGLGYTVEHQQQVNPVTVVDGKIVGGDGSIVLKNDTNKTAVGTYTLVYENKTTMDRFGDNGLVFAHTRTGGNTWEGEGTAYYFVFVSPQGVYFGETNNGWTAHANAGADKIDGFTKEGKHTLVVEYFGEGHSKVYLDGAELFEVNDDTYPTGTGYGFRAGNNGPVLESVNLSEKVETKVNNDLSAQERYNAGGWAAQDTWKVLAEGVNGDFKFTTSFALDTNFETDQGWWRGVLPIVQDGTIGNLKGSVWVTRLDWWGWCDQWDSASVLGDFTRGSDWRGNNTPYPEIMDECDITWVCERVGDKITSTFTIVSGDAVYTHVVTCSNVTAEAVNIALAAEFATATFTSITLEQ